MLNLFLSLLVNLNWFVLKCLFQLELALQNPLDFLFPVEDVLGQCRYNAFILFTKLLVRYLDQSNALGQYFGGEVLAKTQLWPTIDQLTWAHSH